MIYLVLSALFIDIIQIPLDLFIIGGVINRFIDIGMTIIYFRWFKAYGVDFKKTRALIFFGLAALEFIPVVDALPLWIIDVVAVIITVRMEDRLGMSTEDILNDPRKRRILQKGITKAVSVVANVNPEVKAALVASGWGQKQNTGRQNENTPDKVRQAKIAAQQANKSNAKNQ